MRFDQLNLPPHQRIEDGTFRRAVDLIDSGDVSGLQALLKQHPGLVHQRVAYEEENYFRNPTLIEFVAENPVRHRRLPANIAEVARVILDAGASGSSRDEALLLVATGRIPREQHQQLPLIDLLCDFGADPNSAIHAAAVHGEHQSVSELIRQGARVDLPVAAALGRVAEANDLLAAAGREERHLALALASQFGHVEIVRLLLDAGEDPNRYSPAGGHSHSTPLHQAAFAGHGEVVRLLVECGARVDLKDLRWEGTPADWANHAGRTDIEEYLRAPETDRTQER